MWRSLRLNYCLVWLVLLAIAHYRVGEILGTPDFILAAVMQILSFPANFLVAAAIALVPAPGQFWGARSGTTVGWFLFFAAGYIQWFIVVPWIIRKVRKPLA